MIRLTISSGAFAAGLLIAAASAWAQTFGGSAILYCSDPRQQWVGVCMPDDAAKALIDQLTRRVDFLEQLISTICRSNPMTGCVEFAKQQ